MGMFCLCSTSLYGAKRDAPRKEGGPDSTSIDATSPAVPARASIATFPVSKSRVASIGTTGRTNLISFGGTMKPFASEGTAESEAVFAAPGTVEPFEATSWQRQLSCWCECFLITRT
jgi:hypothetical protein